MSPIRTTLLLSAFLALLFAGGACEGSAIIGGDDDDATDDDDAGDDLCGPEPELDEDGVVYGGEVVISGSGEDATWRGCEVEHWIEDDEVECVEVYAVTGEVRRVTDGGTIFALSFTYDPGESTCGEGEDYTTSYRVSYRGDTAILAYRWGRGQPWEEFAESEFEETALGVSFEYLSEAFEWDGDDEPGNGGF